MCILYFKSQNESLSKKKIDVRKLFVTKILNILYSYNMNPCSQSKYKSQSLQQGSQF